MMESFYERMQENVSGQKAGVRSGRGLTNAPEHCSGEGEGGVALATGGSALGFFDSGKSAAKHSASKQAHHTQRHEHGYE